MADRLSQGSASSRSSDGGLDLQQFHQTFFEEAAENLQSMEQLLLALDPAAVDDETLNAIFRVAHSIKGGAATFGFTAVATLAHEMETLLDRLRRHELAPTPPIGNSSWPNWITTSLTQTLPALTRSSVRVRRDESRSNG